jgi:dTDP-4-amino-4,6-dideoxygalactose transaminase
MNLINKEAKSMSNFNFGRIFTSSARSAFLHILNSKLISDPKKGILLPSYIGLSHEEGSGIFDPVRSSGIKFRFYSVTDRLVPNLNEIECFLKSGDFQLFFLVHYFGIPQVNIEDLVALCNSYGVMVIEDCAHVPIMSELSLDKLGRHGNYSIFSIHKNTSTRDGGYYYDNKGDLPVLLKKELMISYETLSVFANTKINMAAEVRLKNYEKIVGTISNFKYLDPFFNEIPEGLVPLNCPIIVGKNMRHNLYSRLVDNGIMPTALYHRLIPEITKKDFPVSHFLAENILNLPTHPDIDSKILSHYIEKLITIIKDVFHE